jgi:4-amino-4-deoxy-L-arabinose transferase-like glycosyltransferase
MSESAAKISERPAWQPTRRQAALVVAAMALVYLIPVSNHWRVSNDSARYMAVGQSLAQGHGFTWNHGESPGGISPGLPMVVAISFRLFGGAFWPLNLMQALLGIGTIILTYRLVRLYAGRREALNVFLLTAFSVALFESSLDILTDLPGTAFGVVAVWCLVRFTRAKGWGWLAAGAALLVVAVALRLGMVVVVAPLAAGVALEKCALPRRLRIAGALAVVAPFVLGGAAVLALMSAGKIPWDAANYVTSMITRFDGVDDLVGYFVRPVLELPSTIFQLLSGQGLPHFADAATPWLWPLVPVAWAVGTAVLAATLWGLGRAWRRGRMIVALLALGYLFFLTVVWSAPAVRYLLPILPLAAWFLVDGAGEAGRRILRRGRGEQSVQIFVSVMVGLLVAMNVPKVAADIYKSHYPNYQGSRLNRWQPLADFLRRAPMADGEVVVTPNGGVVHFLSGRRTVELGDVPRSSYGWWATLGEQTRGLVVRFVVLDRKREPGGLEADLYRCNVTEGAGRVVFETTDTIVVECPPGKFIVPRDPEAPAP